jgi:hypothetical protein
MWRDYQRGGRHDKPSFLKDFLADEKIIPRRKTKSTLPKRQARHLDLSSRSQPLDHTAKPS